MIYKHFIYFGSHTAYILTKGESIMKTINITSKQLSLIIVSSTSIPLIAFVLGFIFSKYQPVPIPLLPLDSIAITETKLTNSDESHDTESTKTVGLEINSDRLSVIDSRQSQEILPPTNNPYLDDFLKPWAKSDDFSFEFLASKDVLIKTDFQPERELPKITTMKKTPAQTISKITQGRPPYALQVGIFIEKKRAIEWAKKIEDKAPKVQIFTNKKPEGQVMYSVITGLFKSKDYAKTSGEQLNKLHHINYYVTSSESFGHEIFRASSTYVVAGVF